MIDLEKMMDKSFTLSLGLRAHQFFHGFESFYHKLSTNLTTNLPQQQLTINLVLLVQNLLHSTTKTLRALPIFCATLNLPQNLTTNFHNSLQTYHKTYHVFIANFRDTRVQGAFGILFIFKIFVSMCPTKLYYCVDLRAFHFGYLLN